jgi:hypothetical protein
MDSPLGGEQSTSLELLFGPLTLAPKVGHDLGNLAFADRRGRDHFAGLSVDSETWRERRSQGNGFSSNSHYLWPTTNGRDSGLAGWANGSRLFAINASTFVAASQRVSTGPKLKEFIWGT